MLLLEKEEIKLNSSKRNTKTTLDGWELVGHLLTVSHAKDYIIYMVRARYTLQTVRNHLVSLVRLGHFIKSQAGRALRN